MVSKLFRPPKGKNLSPVGVQLVVAEHYSKALAERTIAGLKERFKDRRWTGGNPCYGFQIVDDAGCRRIALHPDEAPVVRWVVDTYTSETIGIKEIARRLRQKGIPTRKGAEWSFTSVRSILTNSLITGKVTFNRRKMKLDKTNGHRVPRFKNQSEHMIYQDEALRIISDEVFASIQNRMVSRRRHGSQASNSRQVRPFSGLLFCGCCGQALYSTHSQNSKADIRYYRCSRRQRLGPEGCPNANAVREDHLVAQITDAMKDFSKDTEAIVRDAIKQAEQRTNHQRRQAETIRIAITDIDRKSAKMAEALVGVLDEPLAKKAMLRQMSDLEAKREQLETAAAKAESDKGKPAEQLAEDVREAVAEVCSEMTKPISGPRLHAFVEKMIGPIRLNPDGTLTPVSLEMAKASGGPEANATGYVAGGGFEPPTSGL